MALNSTIRAVATLVTGAISEDALALQQAGIARHAAAALQRAAHFASRGDWRSDIAASPLVTAAALLTRVYHSVHHLPATAVASSLIDIPAVAVNGDSSVELQSGEHVSLRADKGAWPGLLTPAERMRARKKVILSLDKVYAHGGYHARCVPYGDDSDRPVAIIASIAGAQFEMSYLEATQFVLQADVHLPADDAFASYYDVDARLPFNGRMPTFDEATAYMHSDPTQTHFVPFSFYDEQRILYLAAYENAIAEDMSLVLRALDGWSTELLETGVAASALQRPLPAKLWVQMSGVGLGYFAVYCNGPSLSSTLRPAFLRGLRRALAAATLRHVAVLELLDFTPDRSFDLHASSINGVRIEHNRRSLLDMTPEQQRDFLFVAVNPSDAFAFPGNEYGYASTESMLGENTSMRRTQVYLHNAHMLDAAAAWRGVDVVMPPRMLAEARVE